MNRLQTLCSLFFALYTLPSSAIVDVNNNGMSDLWEQRFNTDENIVAQDDADSDGWTNGQEATAGTDPSDANPPVGMLSPELTYSKDVWLDLDGDGLPEFYPALVTMKWPVIPGKVYTLFFSPDLTQESWVPVEQAPSEIEGERTCYIPLTQPEGGLPESGFWRVKVEDVDTDSDGLNDAEEFVLGTKPDSTDGDGDGIGDYDEWCMHHTDPNIYDTDGDGVSDGYELLVQATNPLDAADFDTDGIPDDWEKWWASKILSTGISLSDSERAALMSGNIEPSDEAFDDGTTNAEQYEVSKNAAATGGNPAVFAIRTKRRVVWGSLTSEGEAGLVNGQVRWIGSPSEEPYAPPQGWVTPSASEVNLELSLRAPWDLLSWEECPFKSTLTESRFQQEAYENGIIYTEFSHTNNGFKLVFPDIANDVRTVKFIKVTTTWGYPEAGTNPSQATEMIDFVVPENSTTSQGVEVAPALSPGSDVEVSLAPLEISAAFERDQVANRIPNPKKPAYHSIGTSNNPKETKSILYNRLYIATEPESGKAEITVKHPIIPHLPSEQILIVITDITGNILASSTMSDSGETNIDYIPSGSMVSTRSYVDMAKSSGVGGNTQLLLKSYEKSDGPSIQIAKPENIAGAENALALVIAPMANGTAGLFYQTFIGTRVSPPGAISQDPKIRTISQEPPTMIAGSTYDQASWNTEIRSFLLPDGSSTSNLAENYFSKQAGLGLHAVCRDVMEQNHVQIWNDFVSGEITSKVYDYQIPPGTNVNFYYSGKNNPKYTWGEANYMGGTVTLKLKRIGTKVVAEEIKMQAEIEDYYDFDYTRPTGSFSNLAAIIQIGHEAGLRPRGTIFHTVTEVNFSYNEATGALINGDPPIPFFNANGYIESGAFVKVAGGGGSGNE